MNSTRQIKKLLTLFLTGLIFATLYCFSNKLDSTIWHIHEYGKKNKMTEALSQAQVFFEPSNEIRLSYQPKPASQKRLSKYSSKYKTTGKDIQIGPLKRDVKESRYGMNVMIEAPNIPNYKEKQKQEVAQIKKFLESAQSYAIKDDQSEGCELVIYCKKGNMLVFRLKANTLKISLPLIQKELDS